MQVDDKAGEMRLCFGGKGWIPGEAMDNSSRQHPAAPQLPSQVLLSSLLTK